MSSEPTNPKQKRKADGRIAELEARLSEANKLSEVYLTQLKYLKADLDNLQKQTQRRAEEAIDRGHARIFSELLAIADELGLAAQNTKSEGICMIYNKLLKLLESEGVKQIEAVGKQFDPYRHEAVLEVETLDYKPGTVVEEIRKGYTYKDKALRASMVKVAVAPSEKVE